jgi:oxygen-independent coproporphyrinogen-3 oxidase
VTAADPGFGIYVHWPFCRSKCPYCDFNSHVRAVIDEDRWRRSLLADLDHAAGLAPGRRVTSIFFGGGTPSLMAPATVAAVIDRVAARWQVAEDVEITLEANPNATEAERFRGFRSAGVNRLSLGIQSLVPADLTFLGRSHDAAEARAAIALAASVFGRFSFDLIYARPGQTGDAWAEELQQALDLAVGHLSLYQLTIEPGTAFHRAHAQGALVMPDDGVAGRLYELTQSILDQAGMPAYEISNHARPGEESRHNLTYWRYGDYVGVGPGAHGRITIDGVKYATSCHRSPEDWLAAVAAHGHGIAETTPIAPSERLVEFLMMGLRLAEGIEVSRFAAEFGAGPETLLDGQGLALMREHGFLVRDGGRLAATAAGRQRLNAVLERLLP